MLTLSEIRKGESVFEPPLPTLQLEMHKLEEIEAANVLASVLVDKILRGEERLDGMEETPVHT